METTERNAERARQLFEELGGTVNDGFPAINSPVHYTQAGTPYLKRPGVVVLAKPRTNVAGLGGFLEGFDPEMGNRFSTYATWWIRQAVTRAVADHARTVRLPAHVVDAIYRLRRAENALSIELGREATEEELVERLGVKPEEARRLREVGQPISSINARIGGSSGDEASEMGDLLPDERSGDDYARVEVGQWEQTLVEAVRSLPEREAKVLEMRHGLDGGSNRTLREVSQVLGISQERARQVEIKALRTIRTGRYASTLRRALSEAV